METNHQALLSIDRNHVWHPFTQHAGAPAPCLIDRAAGSYLYTADGRALLDAISSWWVCLHGHSHPHISACLKLQVERLSQVIFAGVAHTGALELAGQLIEILPAGLSRVFYSDNGSTAVEVALKMALQYWLNRGKPRRKFLALQGGYHGDTFGAMAVGERGVFTAAFASLLFEVDFVPAPLRGQAREEALAPLGELLRKGGGDYAALIYEPLVQGAGGMRMQDPEVLSSMLAMAKGAGVLCIADEVMTGFGRTGSLFASDAVAEKPDLICLAKGLTGGTLPLSVTACREEIYEAFLSSDKTRAFFHGHSFTANALGCAAALASLELLRAPECLARIEAIATSHRQFRARLANSRLRAAFADVRQQGTILALELAGAAASGYFNREHGGLASFFLARDILVRPLGNVLYVLPPFCMSPQELERIYTAIEEYATEHGGL